MNNNLEFENTDPKPDSIENNHPRTNYGEGFSKQETLEENEIIDISDHDGIGNAVDNLNNEPPQETTIEEAAKEFVLSHDFSQLTNPNHLANRCFQYGAKWQQERMYSEEEVRQIFDIGQMIKNYGDYKPLTFKEALEQFKKK